jgi:hypothetical protein
MQTRPQGFSFDADEGLSANGARYDSQWQATKSAVPGRVTPRFESPERAQ